MKKPEARLPTLDDVALVAGVSRATVSRAIRDTRRVAPELKELVERAIEQTGYVPNRAARSLATGRAHSIMIAVSGMGPEGAAPGLDTFGDPFFGRVIGGLARSLRSRDRDPVLLLVESEVDRRAVISAARSGATDGALLVSTRADDPLPAAFAAANLPAVTFAAPPDGVALSFVDVANHEGGRLAATRLLDRGAREAAAIAGPLDVPSAAARLRGFRDALARGGQAFVPVAEGSFTLESGHHAMDELLERHPGIDGVFVSNDLMALGALHALHARGIRVPEEVAVIGFDDSTVATLARPALTTVRQPIEDMAERMVAMLLEQLADGDARPSSVVFDPALVIRDSA